MAGDILSDVIDSCLSLEKRGAEIFAAFSQRAADDEEKRFWQELAAETRQLGEICGVLGDIGSRDAVPLVFYRPDETRNELEAMEKEATSQLERYTSAPSRVAALVLAYRVQFYLLHPACGNLLQLAKDVTGNELHEAAYEAYLQRFIEGVRCCGMETPELELLGETLMRLWKKNRQLGVQSHVDPLTGVLNRRGFFRTVAPLAHAAQRNGSNVGIMLIDLDYFKLVGDTYGHRMGDQLIQQVAQSITSELRRSDVVGRFDGDEFIVYLSPVESNSLTGIAENLRHRISMDSERIVPVTVSIGAAQGVLGDDVDKCVEDLVKKADDCQLQAKYTGKNKVVAK